MTLLFLEVLISLLCALGIGYAVRSERAWLAARRAQHEALLRELGLHVEGNPLAAFVAQGEYNGVSLQVVGQASRKPPGGGSEYRTVGVVSLSVALPDMVVCRLDEKDEIMGPVPAVPRCLTGYGPFDVVHAVYVSPEPTPDNTDFRTAPRRGISSWAQPAMLDQLLKARLQWIRVEGRQCSIVLPPIDAENVQAALSLGSSFALAATGRPPCSMISWRSPSYDVGWATGFLVLGSFTAGLLTLCGFMPLAFLPWLRAATEDWVCGPGSRILVATDGEGYTLECSGSPETYLFPHYVTAAGLIVATSLLVMLVISRRLVLRSHRQL